MFVKLITSILFYAAMLIKTYTIEVLFSGYYDLSAADSEFQPSEVICNAYTLA